MRTKAEYMLLCGKITGRGFLPGLIGLGCLFLLEGCCVGNANVGMFRSEAEIRSSLLADTPLGTSAAKVLEFVLDHSCGGDKRISACSEYVEAVPKDCPGRSRLVPSAGPREIDAILSSYPIDLLRGRSVKATWSFDLQDRLTNISVRRFEGL